MSEQIKRNPIRLINAGKGGAGKTTITTSLVWRMLQRAEKLKPAEADGLNMFVIDADPAETLSSAMGWMDKIPKVSLGSFKDSLHETDVPAGMTKTKYVLQKVMQEAVTQMTIGNNKINFAVMGHHEENSCMCAFNSAVNDVLMALYNSDAFDVVIADKEAGIEHINRAVYREKKDVFMIMTWARPDYLRVAREILGVADALGTTKNRMLIVNDVFGGLGHAKAGTILEQNGISGIPYFVFPTLGNIFDTSLTEVLESNKDAQKVLDQIIDFIADVKANNQ